MERKNSTQTRDGVRWSLTTFTSTSSALATHEQRNCQSSGKVLNLKIVLDRFSGAISPMAKYWTTKAGRASHVARLRKRLLSIFSARIFDSSVERGIPSRA